MSLPVCIRFILVDETVLFSTRRSVSRYVWRIFMLTSEVLVLIKAVPAVRCIRQSSVQIKTAIIN